MLLLAIWRSCHRCAIRLTVGTARSNGARWSFWMGKRSSRRSRRKLRRNAADRHEEICISFRSLSRFKRNPIHIAEDNPDAARRVVDEIRATLGSLAKFTHQGHERPDLTSRPLRFLTVRDYLIAYAPADRLRAGREAPLGSAHLPRPSQPPNHRCHPAQQTLTPLW